MPYITAQEVTIKKLTCTHPKVFKCWDYGWMSAMSTGQASYTVALLLTDGSRHDFTNENPDTAIAEAENFLNLL